jgi:hypothetical protein
MLRVGRDGFAGATSALPGAAGLSEETGVSGEAGLSGASDSPDGTGSPDAAGSPGGTGSRGTAGRGARRLRDDPFRSGPERERPGAVVCVPALPAGAAGVAELIFPE